MIQAMALTDGYKVDHRRQMPKEASYQFNTWTPRKTRRKNVNKIMLVGNQYFIKKYLIKEFNDTFFEIEKSVAVKRYKRRIDNYLGADHGITFEHIAELHDLGYMPICIKALPEGTRVNIKVPPVTIESTIPKFVWLVGYLETIYSTTVWGPCTSGTTAFEFRKLLNHYAMLTVGNTDFVQFQGHDFSMRGMFGLEAAMMSGFAHLLSFVGTDTLPAIDFAEMYYNADSDKELVGCSVAATEHSVMCFGTGLFVYNKLEGNWDRIGEAEFSVFKRLITEVYPKGILSIVSDTFNLWKVLNEFLPQLKEEILARDGKIVIRPDSGDPARILCGDKFDSYASIEEAKEELDSDIHDNIDEYINADGYQSEETRYAEVDGVYYKLIASLEVIRERGGYSDNNYYTLDKVTVTSEEITRTIDQIGVVESLWNTFGGTVTEKGYNLLDSHIGCIYGDAINMERAEDICERLMAKGFASINWVAGIGSFSYQFVTRDTDGWAMKATYGEAVTEDGRTLEIPIFKDPITDDGTKKSARGLVQVQKHVTLNQITNRPETVNYVLKDQVSKDEALAGELSIIFLNGELIVDDTLATIRRRVQKELTYTD